MSGISAVIIVKNEEANIDECLKTLSWVDEIVVVDSGSSDRTIDISRKYTDKVYVHEWQGYGPQKNLALGYASKKWVLSIDADERVSAELKSEIMKAVASPDFSGYEIPRLSSYCGRFIHHSGWRPDYVLRLFKRNSGYFTDDLVHERVVVDGSVGRLKKDLVHYSFRDFEQVLNTVNRYSTLGAEQKFRSGQSSGLLKAIAHGLGELLSSYILKGGFLDGRRGLMLAISNAEGAYYKYVKLMCLHEAGRDQERKES